MTTATTAAFHDAHPSRLRARGAQPLKFLLLPFLLLLLGTASAAGLSGTVDFNIEPQKLSTALLDFSKQAGIQVLTATEIVSDLDAPAVRGRMAPTDAIARLLRGTNLKFHAVGANAIAIDTEQTASTTLLSPLSETRGAHDARGSQVRLAQNEQAGKEAPAAKEEPASGKIEEVVVTATKRSENIQDVPLSIGVVTAEDIDRRGLVNAEDYLRGMPGVNQMDAQGYGGQAIIIRGLATDTWLQNFFSGPTTATYFGETPTTTSAGMTGSNVDIKLVDIERVEVLRGPQGTAFGSSSMGGAVRTVPVAPKTDRFEGKVGAGYSQTSGNGGDNYTFQAAGNIPLIADKLAIRATAYVFSDSGYYKNRAGSNAAFLARTAQFGAQALALDEDEVGATYTKGGRIAALFQATEKLRFTASYLSQKSETDGYPVATSGTYEQTAFRVAPEHYRRGETGGVYDTKIDIANGVAEYDLGWGDLLATYSHIKSGTDNVIAWSAELSYPWPISAAYTNPHRENNGEIRLATKLGGQWDFLVGVYGEKIDDTLDLPDVLWSGDPATNFYNPGSRVVGGQLVKRNVEQRAAFGEVSWRFLPGFTLTGGARAYRYDRGIEAFGFGAFRYDLVRNESTSSGETYRANLSYKVGETGLVYAGWSQGFRIGVPQRGLPSGVCDTDNDGVVDGTNITIASTRALNSDSVDNYELGGKFNWFDRRVTVDATLFRMEWEGLPINARAGSTICQGFGYLTNAGAALSEGFELQANFQLSKSVRLDAGGSWVRARLTQDVPLQGFKDGDRLPGSPQVNGTVGLQYGFNVAGHEAYVRTDAIYVGDFYGDILQTPTLKAGDYVKVDAAARVSFGNLSVDLFVRNLTDEDEYTRRAIAPVSFSPDTFGYRPRPRTIGMQFIYDF